MVQYWVQLKQLGDPEARLQVNSAGRSAQEPDQLPQEARIVRFALTVQRLAAGHQVGSPDVHLCLIFDPDVPLWRENPPLFFPTARALGKGVQVFHPERNFTYI